MKSLVTWQLLRQPSTPRTLSERRLLINSKMSFAVTFSLLRQLVKAKDLDPELSRQHSQAAAAAQRPPSHPSPAEHEANVRSLEQQQFSIAKQLNEEQAAVAKKEVELGKWKTAKEDIEKVEIGEGDWADGKV